MRTINDQYEEVELERLAPHPRNPRVGDVDLIAESIDVNGFYGAVVAQRSTGYVLAGNHRLLAARKLGAASMPVVWVDCDATEALRILLADNRTSDLASYHDEVLAKLLQDIQADTGSLVGTGFNGEALEELLVDLAPPVAAEGVREYSPDEFSTFAHTCPRCGFEYDEK